MTERATSRRSSRAPVASADFRASGPAGGRPAPHASRYGETVRETATERHERLVTAIEGVLRSCELTDTWFAPQTVRRIAEQCLDAVEAGF